MTTGRRTVLRICVIVLREPVLSSLTPDMRKRLAVYGEEASRNISTAPSGELPAVSIPNTTAVPFFCIFTTTDMEELQNHSYHSVCHTCLKTKSGINKNRGKKVAVRFRYDDAFRFLNSRPVSRSNSRRIQNNGIVEECCFRSCDLALLEQYCAKPAKSERDLSATSLQVIPAFRQDIPRKHVTGKYSKYEQWQRKAAQRLRRGIPAILRSRKHRRQGEKVKAQEMSDIHKPLISLPSKLPPLLPPTEEYIGHE
ncbi:hypothetical protein P4O66_015297 [Electrophorus voltai]|uniref:Insulin-like growth factor 2 n=1 Tax=Electrophorus voltai TaxID=2609070 RepID=A0AAD8YYZ6_9TELE|nr:hypothetical protein P4O66_015297 [Electrophorus voltai]